MGLGTGGVLAMAGVIACAVGAGVAWFAFDMQAARAPLVTTGVDTSVSAAAGADGEPGTHGWPAEAIGALARKDEEIASLRRQLAEARIGAAARQAFPGLNPEIQSAGDLAARESEGDSSAQAPVGGDPQADRRPRTLRERREDRTGTARAEELIRAHLDRATVDPPLSSEQKDALTKILAQRQEKMRDALLSGGGDGTAATAERVAEAREKLETIRAETKAALEGVITPAQIDALNLIPSARPRGPGAPGGGGGQDGDRGPRRTRGERPR